jgi:hypothetical protein
MGRNSARFRDVVRFWDAIKILLDKFILVFGKVFVY